MAKRNPSDEQWAEARAVWEADDKISFTSIAQTIGISKQAVAKRASNEKWGRRGIGPALVDRAHREADKRTAGFSLPPATFSPQSTEVTTGIDEAPAKKTEVVEVQEVDGQFTTAEQRAEAAAAAKRAEILTRHRNEANALRTNLYDSIKKKDFELGKCAKINAEAMQIVHTLERKAWGLDKGEGGDVPPVIIIDRG